MADVADEVERPPGDGAGKQRRDGGQEDRQDGIESPLMCLGGTAEHLTSSSSAAAASTGHPQRSHTRSAFAAATSNGQEDLVAQLQAQLLKLTEETAEKDALIAALQAQVGEITGKAERVKIAYTKQVCEEERQQSAQLREQVEVMEAKMAQLEHDLREKTRQAEHLELDAQASSREWREYIGLRRRVFNVKARRLHAKFDKWEAAQAEMASRAAKEFPGPYVQLPPPAFAAASLPPPVVPLPPAGTFALEMFALLPMAEVPRMLHHMPEFVHMAFTQELSMAMGLE
ncbi:unnamed protein product [Vitrella brassicaformis CCMP3155]|uniref:Uncharacterized protein n=1 Tax=Vitrella brassicaformis (strain CCMP3155) TaxID=1169540 RepID=A0A0G4EBY2_VITBC|nr:unnamed protein product [Vitrella brassicaformis CCMP3155]|eukprot:CEL93175.1 unnamed protein product [Vitrella brassicaformis CCMP3155]